MLTETFNSYGNRQISPPTKAINKQETQLSQKDCAMLTVIKYFTKSVKITEGHLN